MLYIYSHNKNSAGAKVLAKALNIKRIKHEYSNFSGSYTKSIINWGANSPTFEAGESTVINSYDAVGRAQDKLATFQAFYGDPQWWPNFTTDRAEAQRWLSRGKKVISRALLRASEGRGIGYHEEGELPTAPLYTEYIPKQDEYRIHMGDNGSYTIAAQRKARRLDVPDEDVNWRIRNHDNGFIFAREMDEPVPDQVYHAASNAINALELNFGAVDVVWNSHRQVAYVLEVNTAPGLEGQTIADYTNYFTRYFM